MMVCQFRKIFLILAVALFATGNVKAQVSTGSLDQNADQSTGQYTPMDMGYAGFNSLGMIQSAWLDPLQNLGEGQSKPAYSKYYWTPDLVLPMRLREGMMTLVNFPEWEMVEDIYIGDSATFDGQISGPNTLLLYPKKGANVGVDTNIIVFGRSGNKYVFYVKSEGVNTERLTNSIIDIEVIDGNGKSKASGGVPIKSGGHVNASSNNGNPFSVDSRFTKRFLQDDWLQSIPMDPSKFRFDIEVYVPNPDDVVIAPERVWRDDIFTYIDLGEKSLTMTQRPIVTLIVEKIETPVGFRTKGPNNRLIIVEGIGDMVLRNGKRIVCLKLRRSDDQGLEFSPTYQEHGWDVGPKMPDGQDGSGSGNGGAYGGSSQGGEASYGNGVNSYASGGNSISYEDAMNGRLPIRDNADYAGGQKGQYGWNRGAEQGQGQGFGQGGAYGAVGGQNPYSGYRYGSGLSDASGSNISIELGTDANVTNLETLWSDLSDKYSGVLGEYQPFYSVDAPADGQGKELFHLRVGPVKSLDAGDKVCSQLGRNGVFCSVVRIQ